MARTFRYFVWAAVFCSGALVGCTKTAVQQKTVPDPLLVTKPPVEGQPHAAHASPLRRSESTPPPAPPAEQ